MQDSAPADLKPTVLEQADDRMRRSRLSTYYFFMNLREPVRRPRVARPSTTDDSGAARLFIGEIARLLSRPRHAGLRRGVRHHRALTATEQPPDIAGARG
jgi:hypothetical protein